MQAQDISTPLVTVDTGNAWTDFFMVAVLIVLIAAISVASKVAVDRWITRRAPSPTVVPTWDQLTQHSVELWEKLPQVKRQAMIDDLRTWIPVQYIDAWKKDGFGPEAHMLGGGMMIRNRLRDHMKDDELPPVKYPDGNEYSNWDDYYLGAIEELLR